MDVGTVIIKMNVKMKEEEFLKEHPSLKGKIRIVMRCSECDSSELDDGWCYSCNETIDTTPSAEVKLKYIHETQIDKQKVLDVLKRLVQECITEYGFSCDFAVKLKKELGL